MFIEHISKDILSKYKNARDLILYAPEYMVNFKNTYPVEYKQLTSIYNARSKLYKCIKLLNYCDDVYFGTITFNELKDKNSISSKRKETFKFLNTIYRCFVLIEEFGELNGRYHIHYIATKDINYSFQKFLSWHSYHQLTKVYNYNVDMYLSNYVSKGAPRIRKNKNMIKLCNYYKHLKRLPYKEDYRINMLIGYYLYEL